MSFYPNVTKEAIFELAKLSKQQKNQGAITKENFQTNSFWKKLAGSFKAIFCEADKIFYTGDESVDKIDDGKNHKVTPVELNLDQPEEWTESIVSNVRALPKSNIFSRLMKKSSLVNEN